jgi:hypothetical protein
MPLYAPYIEAVTTASDKINTEAVGLSTFVTIILNCVSVFISTHKKYRPYTTAIIAPHPLNKRYALSVTVLPLLVLNIINTGTDIRSVATIAKTADSIP